VAAPITRYARSGDVHLAYQVIGDGPRDLVLSLDWASHLEVLWEQLFAQELLSALARFARADDYPAGIPEEAAQSLVEQVAGTWGQGTMAAVLGPSVAGNPGMTEWYGRLERFTASPGRRSRRCGRSWSSTSATSCRS
jgi:hypothetical protein